MQAVVVVGLGPWGRGLGGGGGMGRAYIYIHLQQLQEGWGRGWVDITGRSTHKITLIRVHIILVNISVHILT